MTKEKHLDYARKLVDLLDNKFTIGDVKIGIDPLIGLVPVAGDVISGLVTLYLIYVGKIHGVGNKDLLKMLLYGGVDVALGVWPVLGDIVDVAYKSYTKSFVLIEKHLESEGGKLLIGEVVESEVVSKK